MNGVEDMTKKQEEYLESLYEKFNAILDGFIDSSTIEWGMKESILYEFEDIILSKIREIRSDDFYEG